MREVVIQRFLFTVISSGTYLIYWSGIVVAVLAIKIHRHNRDISVKVF